jgi:hypothetical protein
MRFLKPALLCLLILLTACSAVFPTSVPGQTASPEAALPSITPVATLTPTQTGLPLSPTLPATSTPVPRDPILLGEHFTILDWSPDSRSLAFMQQTQQDLAGSSLETAVPGPPSGTFHIYNILNAEGCAYPANNERKLDFNSWHAWLPNGELAVRTESGTLVALNKPCDGQLVGLTAKEKELVDPAQTMPPGAIDSPGLVYRETTKVEPPGYTTTIRRLTGGEAIVSVPWTFETGSPTKVLTPTWVTDAHLLIPQSDRGPLWISPNSSDTPQVQSLAEAFFGQAGDALQSATGTALAGSAIFHIALQIPASGTTPPQIELYHSEDGSVENLPYSAASFAASGQFLELVSSTNDLWVRNVDPPGSEAHKIMDAHDQQSPGWTSDRKMIAVARKPTLESSVVIFARSIPDGVVRYTWQMSGQYGFYNFDQLLWSPDKRFLAVVGTDANNEFSQALFVLSTADAEIPTTSP